MQAPDLCEAQLICSVRGRQNENGFKEVSQIYSNSFPFATVLKSYIAKNVSACTLF